MRGGPLFSLLACIGFAIVYFTPVGSVAEPRCSCRYAGQSYPVGTCICMKRPGGARQRTCCGMVLNNTSWEFTGKDCLTAEAEPAKPPFLMFLKTISMRLRGSCSDGMTPPRRANGVLAPNSFLMGQLAKGRELAATSTRECPAPPDAIERPHPLLGSFPESRRGAPATTGCGSKVAASDACLNDRTSPGRALATCMK